MGNYQGFISEITMATTVQQISTRAADTAAYISTGAELASTAISLIAGMNDAKKRQQFANNLTLLNDEAQKQLQQRLLDAGDEKDRMLILSEYLTDASRTRIDNLTLQYRTEEAKKRTIWLITGGVIIATIAIAGLIIYKQS